MIKPIFIISLFLIVFIPKLKAQTLEQFLHIDRMIYYATDMAGNLKKKEHHDVAKALESLTPEEVWRFISQNEDLLSLSSDSKNYDHLLKQILTHKLVVTDDQAAVVDSNYNFFKNKLNEAFILKTQVKLNRAKTMYQAPAPKLSPIPQVGESRLTLNASHYISNRQTRAIIWDVIKNGRDIEFYMEDLQGSLSIIHANGGKIVGEVETLARNYNKNFLVHYPAENRYAHIITDIGGEDRLYHLTKQLSIVKWNNISASEILDKKVKVFGTAEGIHKIEKERLLTILQVLPVADHVVIGQKAAMERSITIIKKVDLILSEIEKNSELLSMLDATQVRLVEEVKREEKLFQAINKASQWDDIFEKLKGKLPEFANDFEFNIELKSHDMSDISFKTRSGKVKRFRLISNMWGDEVTPLAEALAETGHTNVTYIGTVGSLGAVYKVGDVVSPKAVEIKNGSTISLSAPAFRPKNLKDAGTLVQVKSLFEETEDWLLTQKNKGRELVEMEVGYLAQSLKKSRTHLNVFLLVSDIVGEEGETLDQASSSARKKAQIDTLFTIFEAEDVERFLPSTTFRDATLSMEVENILKSRSELSRFQIKQLAKNKSLNQTIKPSLINELMAQNPGFTPAALQKKIRLVQDFISQIYLESTEQGINFNYSLDTALFDGSYHPKNKINISIPDDSVILELFDKVKKQNNDFEKLINIQTLPSSSPRLSFKSNEIPHLHIQKMYNEMALLQGGLLGKFTRAGNLSFSLVPATPSCNILMRPGIEP